MHSDRLEDTLNTCGAAYATSRRPNCDERSGARATERFGPRIPRSACSRSLLTAAKPPSASREFSMRAHLTILTGAAALSVALSACSVNPAAAVCNGIPVQTGPIPQLIYPVPGYGPVPDDSTFIVVAYPGNPSLAQTITLAEKNGSTVSL